MLHPSTKINLSLSYSFFITYINTIFGKSEESTSFREPQIQVKHKINFPNSTMFCVTAQQKSKQCLHVICQLLNFISCYLEI